jgi:acetyl/propionyl-CoA carboxylase alpha subunit
MGEAAVALARSISYVGAGTVELLVDGSGREPGAELADDTPFWFLEMNTRLQVEHGVTEEVTGLDLGRSQIEIARGERLHLAQDDVRMDGHAIEVRVYAEDPAEDWLPSTGVLHRWRHGPTPRVRYDDGVETGSTVTPYYDPLLSKVIAHAPTRDEAAARLGRALRELQIHGVATNRDHLIDILAEPDFLAGETTTDWIDRHPPVPPEDDPAHYEREWQRFNAIVGLHLAAAVLADPRLSAAGEGPWPFAPTGWRNVGGSVREMRPGESTWRITQTPSGFASQTVSLLRRGEQWDVTYGRVNRDHPLAVKRRDEDPFRSRSDSDLYNVTISGPTGHTPTLVELIPLDDEVTLVHFGRRGHRCTVHVVDDTIYVNSALGQSVFTEIPRFPVRGVDPVAGGPTAPVPGRVVSVEVSVGDVVAAGDTLVVLEAMKVEHRITAAEPATVTEVLVASGDNVEAHQVLVRLRTDA